jgi:hypothetical protein
VNQGQHPGKIRQEHAEACYGERQADRGQQPSDRVPRALPRQQRADRGEGADEHDPDRPFNLLPAMLASLAGNG